VKNLQVLPAPSCEEEHGSEEDDNVDTFFVIGRHGWDVDQWFIYGDPIYDIVRA
jgi:hypothetical protein